MMAYAMKRTLILEYAEARPPLGQTETRVYRNTSTTQYMQNELDMHLETDNIRMKSECMPLLDCGVRVYMYGHVNSYIRVCIQ